MAGRLVVGRGVCYPIGRFLHCFDKDLSHLNVGSRFRRELIFDIGSSNSVVASNREPFLVRVPSRVSQTPEIHNTPRKGPAGTGASSAAAKPSKSKPQNDVPVLEPVRHGRVADDFAAEQLLKQLLRKSRGRWNFFSLRSVGGILVPPFLEKEETARMRALLVDVGFSRIYLIQAPFAAAKGCGLSLAPAQGQMLMDFGGGKVSFALFSLGDLAAWWEEGFGGQELDRAIAAYVARRYKHGISLEAAEEIKIGIGSVFPKPRPETFEVIAVDQRSEVGKKLVLEDNEIRDVLVDACERLIIAFQRGFEAVPPELAGDVARNGITLVGGGGLLGGLPEFLKERTGLDFRLAADPVTGAVRAGGHLLRNGGKGSLRV